MSVTFKILLVGDGGVGKTSFIKRIETGKFEEEYKPTMDTTITKLMFNTTAGNVIFNVWDCPVVQNFAEDADAIVYMFAVTNINSYKHLLNWYETINNITGDIPAVLCGNKIDRQDISVVADFITLQKMKCEYFTLSSKIFDRRAPFLYLIRQLLGDDNITIKE